MCDTISDLLKGLIPSSLQGHIMHHVSVVVTMPSPFRQIVNHRKLQEADEREKQRAARPEQVNSDVIAIGQTIAGRPVRKDAKRINNIYRRLFYTSKIMQKSSLRGNQ